MDLEKRASQDMKVTTGQLPELEYEGLPVESPQPRKASYVGSNINLGSLASIAGLRVSAMTDESSITWPGADEITLKLAPTPERKPGVWISGFPFTSEYEGENEDSRSKLLGEEGDLVVVGEDQIAVINKLSKIPKPLIPGTYTPVSSINVHIIDAKGHLSEMKLPERQIKDIFEEASTGIVPYPDH